MTNDAIEIWTDGACIPNPGRGGWGYLVRFPDGRVVEAFGGESQTTCNAMELTAIINALRSLPDGASAAVYSDSTYCVNGSTVWSKRWARRSWYTKGGAEMPNRSLWLALETEKQRLVVSFHWVRGHSGDPGNERADQLAAAGWRATATPTDGAPELAVREAMS